VSVEARIVTDRAELEGFIAEWDALAVECAAPYSAPGWMLSWWDLTAPATARLFVVTAVEGGYYGACLAEAKEEGRIGNVARDPLMTVRAIWDIGGTGIKADACAIWIVQFIGREIRVLDYYEAVGQPLAAQDDAAGVEGGRDRF
jgi:hypothetical protein